MDALTRWNPFRKSDDLEEWGRLARWNPMPELDRMQRDIERLFDGSLARYTRGREAMTLAEWSPGVDISGDDKEFLLKAELPEVKKQDVKVTVENGVLTLRGERKAEKEEKGKKCHRVERSHGSFERSFSLPDATDATRIASEFKDGMLTVHLPKNPNGKSKAVEVKIP